MPDLMSKSSRNYAVTSVARLRKATVASSWLYLSKGMCLWHSKPPWKKSGYCEATSQRPGGGTTGGQRYPRRPCWSSSLLPKPPRPRRQTSRTTSLRLPIGCDHGSPQQEVLASLCLANPQLQVSGYYICWFLTHQKTREGLVWNKTYACINA